MPVTARQPSRAGKGQVVAAVMIGVDPHKGSHTAVVIDQAEVVLGQVRVRASTAQVQRLVEWAAAWPERTWAVEGARGMGYLLAQQLVAAGELVLDVQPKLGARVRLLATGKTNKNDPNDALSVAIAALRSTASTLVRPDDHTTVLKVWTKRHRDLSRSRNQVVCRLHAVLCDLIPGGVSKQIRAGAAARVLEQARPSGAVQQARHELAAQFLADLCRIDAQLRETRKKLAAAVGVNALAGAVMHMVLIVVFFALAGHDLTKAFKLPSGSKILLVLAVIIAVIGVVLATRPGRRWTRKKLIPGLRSAAGSLRQAAASPVKLGLLFGGSALITLAYIAALAASIQAFGGGPGLVVLGAVYLAAAALAAAAPTPGGLGAIEAALVAGLTGVGMQPGPAVSAVLLYRLATYWLPVLPGWLCWRFLQHREYV